MFYHYVTSNNPVAQWVRLVRTSKRSATVHNRRRDFFNSLNRMRWQDFVSAFYSDCVKWRLFEWRAELLRYRIALRNAEEFDSHMSYVLTSPNPWCPAPWNGQEFKMWMEAQYQRDTNRWAVYCERQKIAREQHERTKATQTWLDDNLEY